MRLPRLDDIEFSPLAWKEWFLNKEIFGSKEKIYDNLKKWNKAGHFKYCIGIENHVRNKQIKRLLNGYAILDLLDWTKRLTYERFKMWRLFEDTVGEILRELSRAKRECTVAYVDRWPGFKGLDYVIINSKNKLGWKAGFQCKRYVGTKIPYCKIDEYSPYSRGTSASKLYDQGNMLNKMHSGRRKFVLVMFNAYREGKQKRQRFNWLKEAWDLVVVFNKPRPDEDSYTYRLSLDAADKIVQWC